MGGAPCAWSGAARPHAWRAGRALQHAVSPESPAPAPTCGRRLDPLHRDTVLSGIHRPVRVRPVETAWCRRTGSCADRCHASPVRRAVADLPALDLLVALVYYLLALLCCRRDRLLGRSKACSCRVRPCLSLHV